MKFENLRFKIHLYSEYFDTPPIAEISIDGNVIHKGKIKNKEEDPFVLKFDKLVEQDKEHTLTINRSGKGIDQVVFENGEIIKDQKLFIHKIEIDDIDIGSLVYEGVYTPEYDKKYHEQQVQEGKTPPETIKQTKCLGHNGVWNIRFTSPFYMWMLENLY